MSTRVGSIHYELGLDTSRFERASSTIDGKVGAIVKSLGLAFAALTGAAVVFATKSAADYEQSRIALETMLGSADKAKTMLQDLSDFATRTPFDLPQVVEGAKSLLAYGIAAEEILPDFEALGNIAAGVGKDKLPFLTLAFGQTATKGKLFGQEIRQFTEAGVPLVNELAKSLGKTGEEVIAMSEKGEISFAEVRKAIRGMSGEGGRFFNLMERQSGTFSGRISNIKDQFGRLARDLIGINEQGDIKQGGVFYHLSNGAAALLNALYLVKPTLDSFFQTVVNLASMFWNFFGPSIMALVNAFRDNLLPSIMNLWNALQPGFMEVVKVIAIVLGATLVAALWLVINTLNVVIQVISTVVNVISNLIKWVGNLVGASINAAKAIIGAFVNMGGAVAHAIGSVVGAIRNGIGAALSAIWNFYGRFVDAGWGLITAFANGIKNAFGRAVDAVKNGMKKVREYLPFSDAKKGPLSDLTLSGQRFAETFAQGIYKGSGAIAEAASSSLALTGMPQTAQTPNVSTSIFGNINIGSEVDSDRFMRRLTRNQELARMGGTAV